MMLLRTLKLVGLISLGLCAQNSNADEPGQLEGDPGPGQAFIDQGSCFFRVKGNFKCPKKDRRDPDVFESEDSGLSQIDFSGHKESPVAEICTCDTPPKQHTFRWTCDCPVSQEGLGTFRYAITCRSPKTGLTENITNLPQTFQVDCP